MLDPNCEYKCNDQHKVLDRPNARMIPCPACSKFVRTKVESDYNLSKELGFPHNLTITDKLDLDSLVPGSDIPFIDEESMKALREYLPVLWGTLSQGQLPSRSICIGLGAKGRIHNLAYPLMATAYAATTTVAPITTTTDLTMWKRSDRYRSLEEMYSASLAITVIEEGATRVNLSVAKGVMQSRALRGRPTIFITTMAEDTLDFFFDSEPASGYFMAEPHFLSYKMSRQPAQGTSGNKYTSAALGL